MESARLLVWDDGPLGLRAIFEKARFPIALLPPFRVAIEVVKETGYAGGDTGRRDYQVMALARVFEECGAIGDRLLDDLLLQLFDQKSDEVIEAAMAQAGNALPSDSRRALIHAVPLLGKTRSLGMPVFMTPGNPHMRILPTAIQIKFHALSGLQRAYSPDP